ncbi:MAG: WbqC family protein [Nitrospiraceae bacterium]
MRMGIMQPYFFPYLGHFSLIASVDKWIVFDVTQYTPKTWMNRNRILHPKVGWQYVTVPLLNSSISIKTAEAKVLKFPETKQSIIGKLSHYKRTAPYFYQVNKVVQQAFDGSLDDSLVSLNVSALRVVCDYLKIPFPYQICSKLELEYLPKLGAGEWAPYICQMLGASEYVNPAGGQDIFDISVFRQRGITLYFAEFAEFKYMTHSYSYEPNLSIIDVMMWNSPQDIVAGLKQGTKLIKAS